MLSYDLVFGARLLRKSPGFTLVATISLALAIGANTSIFSIARQLLFERLDIPDAASLRLLTATDAKFSYPGARTTARTEPRARRSAGVSC